MGQQGANFRGGFIHQLDAEVAQAGVDEVGQVRGTGLSLCAWRGGGEEGGGEGECEGVGMGKNMD